MLFVATADEPLADGVCAAADDPFGGDVVRLVAALVALLVMVLED